MFPIFNNQNIRAYMLHVYFWKHDNLQGSQDEVNIIQWAFIFPRDLLEFHQQNGVFVAIQNGHFVISPFAHSGDVTWPLRRPVVLSSSRSLGCVIPGILGHGFRRGSEDHQPLTLTPQFWPLFCHDQSRNKGRLARQGTWCFSALFIHWTIQIDETWKHMPDVADVGMSDTQC